MDTCEGGKANENNLLLASKYEQAGELRNIEKNIWLYSQRLGGMKKEIRRIMHT